MAKKRKKKKSKSKKKIFKLIVFILIVSCIVISGIYVYDNYVNYSYPRKDGTYIVIDAGHGGYDPGAVGYINGVEVHEKDVNLKMATKLKERLEQEGYNVLMTRSDDEFVSINDRKNIINKYNPHLAISLHCDAAPEESRNTAEGFSVLYIDKNMFNKNMISNKKYAEIMKRNVSANVDITDRGIVNRPELGVLQSKNPTILLEMGFITNPQEVKKLTGDNFQNKMIDAITKGIKKSLKTISNMNK